jgi:Zn-dependent protease with chaperone function
LSFETPSTPSTPSTRAFSALPADRVRVDTWPSEKPLFILVLLLSIGIWGMLLVSIVGAIYGGLIAVAIFFGHLLFVTHIRGSALKLGPTQLPELHARVELLARRAGLAPVPDAYVLESGGALNAFATKFFRGRIIVLYTDLLEACGEDDTARDMVIGHELGHHKAGHLDWMWLIAPGMLIPFLGAAYSRAREYTCDRWGAALCADTAGAIRGLTILAAGGKLARRVDLAAFVAQKRDLDTGWMTLGKWLSTYPPLGARIEALEPRYASGVRVEGKGPLRAAGLLAGCLMLPTALVVVALAIYIPIARSMGGLTRSGSARPPGGSLFPNLGSGTASSTPASQEGATRSAPIAAAEVPAARARAIAELDRLEAAARSAWAAGWPLTDDATTLAELWSSHGDGGAMPIDPFSGEEFPFVGESGDHVFLVYSLGPDGESATDDDIDRSVKLPAR